MFRFARRLVVGTVLLYVASSLLLGGTRAAKPTFSALAAAWSVLLAASTWKAMHRPDPGRLNRSLEILATNVAFALVLSELGLRCCAAGDSLFVNDTLDAHRLAPGHDYGGLRGNRLGYPGPDFPERKRPGIFRIAALGDSFAVGPAVPYAANYLHLLGQSLPDCEVLNFGVSGAGPREYLAVLRRDVWAFQPDLVLVSVFVGNDITESLPAPRWLDPRQHALYLLLRRGWLLTCERQRQAAAPAATTARGPCPPLSPDAFRAVEARRISVCVEPSSAAMERKWRRALKDLGRLVSDCRRRDVRVAVVLIPDEFQVNPRVLNQAASDAGHGLGALTLDLPQRRLRAFFDEQNVPCLDLLPAFTGESDTYAVCDTHWNERGNRLAAEQVGRWLAGRER
jgi:hypothetical protein